LYFKKRKKKEERRKKKEARLSQLHWTFQSSVCKGLLWPALVAAKWNTQGGSSSPYMHDADRAFQPYHQKGGKQGNRKIGKRRRLNTNVF
jgi:hypothetical protein